MSFGRSGRMGPRGVRANQDPAEIRVLRQLPPHLLKKSAILAKRFRCPTMSLRLVPTFPGVPCYPPMKKEWTQFLGEQYEGW